MALVDRNMDRSTTSNSSAHGAARASSTEMGSRDAESARNDLAISDIDDNVLDWLGRRATTNHGGPKTSFFILGNQALWNVANTAVSANLVVYLNQVLQMSNASAANSVTNWNGTLWAFTLVGGIMGDSYVGRFWTCIIFQVLHLLGMLLLSITVSLGATKPAVCPPTIPISMQDAGTLLVNCPKPPALQTGIFMLALYIIAFGTGGYLPVFQALGADQLNSAAHRTTFFGWLFVCNNVGAILASTVFVWVENQGRWALAYWVATAVGALASTLFGIGTPLYRHFRPAGNPLKRIAQVIVASLRNWKFELPKDDTLLHELDEEELTRRGCQKMPHTSVLRFLDKAATKEQEQMVQTKHEITQPLTITVSGWKLCYVTQVEEVKTLCRMLPIFLTNIPFTAFFAQMGTFFVEQGLLMDTTVGGSFHIPPASMNVVTTLTIVAFTLLYPVVAVPIARLITHRKEGLSQFQRMAVGQILSAVAVAVAALLERKRLQLAMEGVQLSLLWQTPQWVIMGASVVFFTVAQMDFFYTESPPAIRGMMSSLSFLNIAIGSYLSSALVSIVVHITTHNGHHPGWIPDNLNDGHLDYFFWLLFVVTIVSIVFFLLSAWWFNHTGKPHATKISKLASFQT